MCELNVKREHVCSNYKGSSGNMKAVGAFRIFERSLIKRDLQYTEYYGDGDSKGFLQVKDIYGENSVTKLECIGHIQKRVNLRLRKLKKNTKGLGGKGKLTDKFIDKLQNYYGIVIRSNVGCLEKMQSAVIAAFFHSCSSNKNPMHGNVQQGKTVGASIKKHYVMWIPSHVDIFGNEQADRLAREGCSLLTTSSPAITYSEHQSKINRQLSKEWKIPPSHHWYAAREPGSFLDLNCDRASKTAISRLASGHSKSLSFFEGRKTFKFCSKCKVQQASVEHILDCLGLSREDLYDSPLLVIDFLRVNNLMDLV
ncbi:uncharacterized protein TNCV_1174481 [Trichonephila clavipes]|nr:uncharacterized protein TNCV_1174481 [Trichonephila clavipes]